MARLSRSEHGRILRNTSAVVGRVLFDAKYRQMRREMGRLDFAINLMFLSWLSCGVSLVFRSEDALRVAVLLMALAEVVALFNFFWERRR